MLQNEAYVGFFGVFFLFKKEKKENSEEKVYVQRILSDVHLQPLQVEVTQKTWFQTLPFLKGPEGLLQKALKPPGYMMTWMLYDCQSFILLQFHCAQRVSDL